MTNMCTQREQGSATRGLRASKKNGIRKKRSNAQQVFWLARAHTRVGQYQSCIHRVFRKFDELGHASQNAEDVPQDDLRKMPEWN